MVQEAVRRETPDTYRDVFKTIVHSRVEELLKRRDRKDIKIEINERDDDAAT